MTHATVFTDGIPSESRGHLVLWWWEQLCMGISWWKIVGLVGHHTATGMGYGMPWKRPQPSSCRCRTSPHPTPSKHHSPIISCRATQMAWSSMTSILEEFNDELGAALIRMFQRTKTRLKNQLLVIWYHNSWYHLSLFFQSRNWEIPILVPSNNTDPPDQPPVGFKGIRSPRIFAQKVGETKDVAADWQQQVALDQGPEKEGDRGKIKAAAWGRVFLLTALCKCITVSFQWGIHVDHILG